jgi:hypothetical protein
MKEMKERNGGLCALRVVAIPKHYWMIFGAVPSFFGSGERV